MRCGRLLRETGGQAIVIVALSMSVMLAGVGLAIDTGQLFTVRRDAQAAADAAAWAGAIVLFEGGTDAEAEAAAIVDATLNGYTTGGNVTVTANAPPLSGDNVGADGFIEVIIEEDVDTAFLSGAAAGLTHVEARAVAGTLPLESEHAIHTLSYDEPESLKLTGNGGITVGGAGILVNSNDGDAAAKLTGNANVTVADPYEIEVVGGYEDSSNGAFDPTPTTGAQPQSDPLTFLSEPDITFLTDRGDFQHSGNDNVTIYPGKYDGIRVNSNGDVTMMPGLYVMLGDGFEISGNGDVIGDGITIFNTISTYPSAGGQCTRIQISGNGALDISPALTTAEVEAGGDDPDDPDDADAIQGMLIWQDDACSERMQLTGNGDVTSAAGTIYLPSGDLSITGNGGVTSMSLQILAQNVELTGNGDLDIALDPDMVVPLRAPALYE